jgi:CheY-like chemotaxis protein
MKAEEVNLYIIVADDDMQDHELIKKAVSQCGLNHIVTSVYNGLQLMNLLLGKGFYKTDGLRLPDAIILDLKMQVMDGFEVLEKIRGLDKFKDIPVYVLSGSSSPRDKKKALELGANGFYTKPVNYAQLAKAVREICDSVRKD